MRDRSASFRRRTFLRGVGVTMALPWMESITAWGDDLTSKTDAVNGGAPARLGVLFSGNGFHSREWWAKGEGAMGRRLGDLELGEPLRRKIQSL